MALFQTTRLYITTARLHSTRLYIRLPWLYFTLLDSTLLYNGSTSIYYTLYYSTMALLQSPRLYITLPWLYFTLLDSTLLETLIHSEFQRSILYGFRVIARRNMNFLGNFSLPLVTKSIIALSEINFMTYNLHHL